MPNVLLVTTSDLLNTLSAELDTWRADRIADGWTVSVRATTAATGYALRAELAAMTVRPDHVFLLGPVPTLFIMAAPDGHEMRRIGADPLLVTDDPSIDAAKSVADPNLCTLPMSNRAPWAATGRLFFEGITGIDPIEAYRSYFTKRHAYTENGAQNYPLSVRSDDHLNYTGFNFIGDAVAGQFSSVKTIFTRLNFGAVDDDGELEAHIPCLIWIGLSGGYSDQKDALGNVQEGLFYIGGVDRILAHPPAAPFAALFGSRAVDIYGNSDLRATLCGPDVIATGYDSWGAFQWSSLLAGKTMGQAALATQLSTGSPYIYMLGDPTVALDPNSVQNLSAVAIAQATAARMDTISTAFSNISMQFTQIQAQVSSLQPGAPTGTPGAEAPPPSSGTGLAAPVRYKCGPGAFDDWHDDASIFSAGSGTIVNWNSIKSGSEKAVNAPAGLFGTARVGATYQIPLGLQNALKSVRVRVYSVGTYAGGPNAFSAIANAVPVASSALAYYQTPAVAETTVGVDAVGNLHIQTAGMICGIEVI
jgi:hypothetical protein